MSTLIIIVIIMLRSRAGRRWRVIVIVIIVVVAVIISILVRYVPNRQAMVLYLTAVWQFHCAGGIPVPGHPGNRRAMVLAVLVAAGAVVIIAVVVAVPIVGIITVIVFSVFIPGRIIVVRPGIIQVGDAAADCIGKAASGHRISGPGSAKHDCHHQKKELRL